MKIILTFALLSIFVSFVVADENACAPPAQQLIAEYNGTVTGAGVQPFPLHMKESKLIHIHIDSKDDSAQFRMNEQGKSFIELPTTDWSGKVPEGDYTVEVLLPRETIGEVAFHLRLEESMNAADSNQKTDCDLKNTRWKLVELNGEEVTVPEGASDIHMTLSLEENKVNGFAGCNTFFGTYETKDNSLSFSKVGATRMACPQLDLEGAFLKAIDSVQEYKIQKDELTLYSAGQPVAVFKALYLQ